MKEIAIIGPSHAKQLRQAQQRGELSATTNIHIQGFQSAPIFSEYFLDEVNRCRGCRVIYLYVAGSMRFNFKYHNMNEKLVVLRDEHDFALSQDPKLFSRKLLKNTEVVNATDLHLRKWLDWYSLHYPQIQFIFWCEFMSYRKRCKNKAPSIIRNGYQELRKHYPNSVDIKKFQLQTGRLWHDLLQPDGSHKNTLGRILFCNYLNDA